MLTSAAASLRYADQTLVLSRAEDEDGRTYTHLVPRPVSDAIVEMQTSHQEEVFGTNESTAAARPNEASSVPAKKVQPADETRATGEYATYKYYFNSIGLWKTLMMVGFCASYGFLINFMGELPDNNATTIHVMLTPRVQEYG